MNKLKIILRNENGQSLVLMAVLITVLIGLAALVVDVGAMYHFKAKLQNAADAACLAGAQQLPDDPAQADAVARDYATANGIKSSDTVTVTIPSDNRSIKVDIERNVPLIFANVFNLSTKDISAHAKANIGVAASVPWIVPFVIPKPASFDYEHVYVMRMYGAGSYPSGYNYPADYKAAYPAYPKASPYPYHFDYMNVKIKAGSNPSSEFSDYLKYLQYGYQETFSINQNMLYYAPSSGGIPSVDTFQKRVSADPNTDYTKAKIGDPRVMLIPIVATMLPRNTAENTKVKIIGFAGFWLKAVHKNSYYETFWFEGRFLKDLNIGSGDVTYDPNADFGLRVVKLTE
ncbi:MAG: pilus assembly protein TadG-related protein [Ignavibacteriales bacterium]